MPITFPLFNQENLRRGLGKTRNGFVDKIEKKREFYGFRSIGGNSNFQQFERMNQDLRLRYELCFSFKYTQAST